MKYIVCKEPGTFLLEEKGSPQRKEGEALLRITKIGICGTDLHAYQGNQSFFTYPRILGHELAAEILEIGDNPQGLKVGEKVIIMPYLSCGKCIACRNEKNQLLYRYSWFWVYIQTVECRRSSASLPIFCYLRES